jgi:dGTPase
MDLADDIAYSTYDLEDAMKAGFSHPLGIRARLLADPDLIGRVHRKVHGVVGDATEKKVFRTLNGLLDFGPVGSGAEDGGLEAMTQLNQSLLIASQGYLRASFTSSLIKRFLAGISVAVPTKGKEAFAKVSLGRGTLLEIESLKHLNYELMIMSPRLKVVEYRGYELVQTIFTTLDSKSGYLLLPEDYRLMHERMKSKVARKRLICDFIAGMTDRYAVEFYGRLKESGASIFKPI